MDLGPEMRYSLVSGYQRNGENVSGWDYCLTPEEKPRYRAIRSIEEKITSIMDGYMNSPGHRDNILHPWHRKVNLGFSWDTHLMWNVQQFEGDYADCNVPPMIDGTTLRVSCTTKEVLPSKAYTQVIYYNPTPHTLTQGQIAPGLRLQDWKKGSLPETEGEAGYRIPAGRRVGNIRLRLYSLRH